MSSTSSPRPVCGRLAPSPTGLLHLGNAWAFLLAWLACRAAHGRLILRLEDIDPARSRPEYAVAVQEDLRWLGLDWDDGPVVQSQRLDRYAQALDRLTAAGLVYPCTCTRRELREIAGAPHPGTGESLYPGTCRALSPAEQARRAGRPASLRLACPLSDRYVFIDGIAGEQNFSLAECGGDFALRRSDGVFAYQLAVAVDDGEMGVTQVVRGNDILPSTPRQLLLLDLLGHARPDYAHTPLILDHEGERLAKRHAALSLCALREQGVDPRVLVGVLARLAGLRNNEEPLHPAELVEGFSFSRLPREHVRLEQDWVSRLGIRFC